MNNAEQTDVSDHSLMSPDAGWAGTAIIPLKQKQNSPDFKGLFSVWPFFFKKKKAPHFQCANAKLPP